MRSLAEIQRLMDRYDDLCEYEDQNALLHQIECHGRAMPDELEFNAMMARHKRLEAKYGADVLEISDDFSAGVINGFLSALQWVLGSDFDNPDPIVIKLQH